MRVICVIFLMFFSCKEKLEKEDNSRRKVAVDYGVLAFSDIQKENDSIIKLLEDCINTQKFSEYEQFWVKTDTMFFKWPYDDLHYVVNNNFPDFKPTIIAIQKIAIDKFLLKIAIMGNLENFNSLDFIYNVYVIRGEDGKFLFKNTIEDNLKNWTEKRIENISYYYSRDRVLNLEKIQEQISFENYLVNFIGAEKINYKYVICKNIHEIYQVLGYDYENSMFFTEQSGALSYSYQNIFFAGNDSEYYPHEVVHIYTHENFPNLHAIINEGFATYLGGSKELDFKEHIKILKKYLQENDISLTEYLFDDHKRYTIIGPNSSIMYSAGALLCDLALKKHGKKGLFDLMESGKSNDELKNTIENLFSIKMENFDFFIKENLIEYNFDETEIN